MDNEVGHHATVLIEGPHGRLLMFYHHAIQKYCLPGGTMEPGEMAIVAAARELKEELGIEALHLSFFKSYAHHVVSLKNPQGKDWVGHFFSCEAFKGIPDIMEPTKASDLRWLTLEEIKEKSTETNYLIAQVYLHR